jgi:hypothetical protein
MGGKALRSYDVVWQYSPDFLECWKLLGEWKMEDETVIVVDDPMRRRGDIYSG